MSNSHLTAAAVPGGNWQGAGPTVQFLAGAGEGSTAQGEDSEEGTGQQVAGTGEAAHLDLQEICINFKGRLTHERSFARI